MKKEKSPRPADAEINRRVKIVQEKLLEGYTRREIMELGSQWDVCERQMETYLARATENIREINKNDIEDTIAMLHLNYLELFRFCKQTGDIEEAHKVLNSIAKLKGAYEIKITKTVINKFDSMGDDDLSEVLEDELGPH